MILLDTDIMIDLTFNQKHYAAIPGLKTVQPYQRSTP
jgi:hypothetical protein